MRLEGNIDACEATTIGGWARDADAPGQPLTLDVRIGATPFATIRANLPRADLAAQGLGDCRFHLPLLSPLAPADRDRLNLRPHGGTDLLVANLGGPQPDPWATPMPPPGTRFRRAILHIGTEKTGTTTLQHFFSANRTRLAEAGILAPTSLAPEPAPLNHTHLVAHALADWRLDDELRTPHGITTPTALDLLRDITTTTATIDPTATTWTAHWLGEKLRTIAPGHGPTPPPDAIATFMAQFTETNETVRREWFPDRPTLFPPPPPLPTPDPPSREALIELFARVLLEERKLTGG